MADEVLIRRRDNDVLVLTLNGQPHAMRSIWNWRALIKALTSFEYVPRLGDDNSTILTALGYREQEVAALAHAGIIHSG